MPQNLFSVGFEPLFIYLFPHLAGSSRKSEARRQATYQHCTVSDAGRSAAREVRMLFLCIGEALVPFRRSDRARAVEGTSPIAAPAPRGGLAVAQRWPSPALLSPAADLIKLSPGRRVTLGLAPGAAAAETDLIKGD